MWPADQTAFRPLQRYEQVADRLAADIAAGTYAVGERLPSERDLARALEVSRASVREAIASLQVHGLVETRPGAGTFIAATPPRSPVAPAHDASPSSLLEARALLEPEVAAFAARLGRPDPALDALLAGMEAGGDPEDPASRAAWSDADRRFHRQIATMTGNPVLVAFADHVAELMDEPLWQRLRDDSIAVPGRVRVHAAEHRMIYEAVVDGDPDAARFYAAQHLKRVRTYMELS